MNIIVFVRIRFILFHGVWVNEEVFLEKKNAYDPAVTNDFKEEIKRTVDLIHGHAILEERAGSCEWQICS